MSHLPRDGAERGAYGIGKDAVSGKGIGERTFTGVRSRIWCYPMSNPRNTRDAYSTPANAPVAVRYARTPARAEFVLIT